MYLKYEKILPTDNIKTIIRKKIFLQVRSDQVKVFLREYSKVKQKPIKILIDNIKNNNIEQENFLNFLIERTDIPI